MVFAGVKGQSGKPGRAAACRSRTRRWPSASAVMGWAVGWLSGLLLALEGTGATWSSGEGFRYAALAVPAEGHTGFTRVDPEESGVRFTNAIPIASVLVNNNLLNGAGVALGDVNGDGLVDLYFCNLGGSNALYLNRGGWRFQDVTEAAGAGCPGQASTAAVFADVTGDGHLDLLVNALGGGTRLFLNDGAGMFREAASPGLARRYGGASMALGDLDGDGLLDLYVANYADMSLLRSGGALSFRWIDGKPVAMGPHAHRLRWVDGKVIELGDPDVVYRNLGGGRFEPLDWTQGAFLDEAGLPLAEPPTELGLSVAIRDINGDGRPDIYVSNDFEFPDRVWIQQASGTFRAIDPLALRNVSHFSMAVDFADINRDGYDDFFVADMLSRSHRLRVRQLGVPNPPARRIGEYADRPLVRRNTLFLNRGDGSYAELANLSGVEASDWTWSVVFLDVDLDGYEDLLIGNGHWFDIQDHDAIEAMWRQHGRGRPTVQQVRQYLLLYPRLLTPNFAFRNRGDLTFEEVGTAWGFDSTRVSQGMALADLDGDGDLDLVINCLNDGPLLYRNETIAPRVAVRLRGDGGNTRGIGARMILRGGAVAEQSQEMISGGRYLSGDQALRVFAGNREGEPMSLEVRWRSGRLSRIQGVRSDHLYEVFESGAQERWDQRGEAAVEVAAHFVEVSQWLGHRHAEEAYDDFARQPLLPRRLSQLGPGLGWVDVDGDGHEDLVIGSGRAGALGVYRNLGGTNGFERVSGLGVGSEGPERGSRLGGRGGEAAGVSGPVELRGWGGERWDGGRIRLGNEGIEGGGGSRALECGAAGLGGWEWGRPAGIVRGQPGVGRQISGGRRGQAVSMGREGVAGR
jgi:enediyne biosynthesis protein E4